MPQACRYCCCAMAMPEPSWKAWARQPSSTTSPNCRKHWKSSASDRSRAKAGDVVDGDGLGKPFQHDVADLLEAGHRLDRAGHALADQDLAVLGLVAEPGGNIADCADRGVVDPLGKADLAQRCKALGDADAEADLAAAPAPIGLQPTNLLAHLDRHAHGALGRVGTGQRVVENYHQPIAGEVVERAFRADD